MVPPSRRWTVICHSPGSRRSSVLRRFKRDDLEAIDDSIEVRELCAAKSFQVVHEAVGS